MLHNLEAERARAGLTKEEVSKKLEITSTTYLKYVRGGNPPTSALLKMSELFGCSVDYLLGITDKRNRAS